MDGRIRIVAEELANQGAYHFPVSLFFGIIEVEIEEQHGRVRLRRLLIAHVVQYRRAENGLSAARNPMQPEKRPMCSFPISICSAFDEPQAGIWVALSQRFVVVRRWIRPVKPFNDLLMLVGYGPSVCYVRMCMTMYVCIVAKELETIRHKCWGHIELPKAAVPIKVKTLCGFAFWDDGLAWLISSLLTPLPTSSTLSCTMATSSLVALESLLQRKRP